MNPALLVKLRPSGPWRIGPASGARDQVDLLYHSDSLFSAVTHAMGYLGFLDAWLNATARRPEGAAVRFSSCFPFMGAMQFIVPPRTIWPPAPSAKVRWKGARFVPVSVVQDLLSGHPVNEERWSVDGESECLVPSGRTGPFRSSLRSSAAVDRMTGNACPHSTACLEFMPDSGLWCALSFADETAQAEWDKPVRAALRWLADSGFGGKRSGGWGRSEAPEFLEGTLPDLIIPSAAPVEGAYWLLSLFSPSPSDSVDWQRGNYGVTRRGGRIESTVASGAAKKLVDMIEEGSVLVAAGAPSGNAPNVAPDGFAHPVYRAGFALSIPIPTGAQS